MSNQRVLRQFLVVLSSRLASSRADWTRAAAAHEAARLVDDEEVEEAHGDATQKIMRPSVLVLQRLFW